MQCIHSLPMRPCLAASRAACRAVSSSDGYQALRGSHRLLCRASAAKQTSKWEQDLAEVLREPQVRGHFSSHLRHLCFSILLLLQSGALPERADKPLQDWQLQKLQAAAAIGRRKIKVCYSCVHSPRNMRRLQSSVDMLNLATRCSTCICFSRVG